MGSQTGLYHPAGSLKMMRTVVLRFYRLLLGCAVLLLQAGVVRGADTDLAEMAGTMHTWHAADGLPSDSLTAIIQTRDGFLWLGTEAGLSRFDGVKFTALSFAAFTTNRVVYITTLCEDSRGCLWIGTLQDGLFELVGGKLRHFLPNDGLLDENVTSLAADNQGHVWVGGKSGLNLWTGQEFKSFTTRDGLPDDFVSGVNVARSGTVWITTRAGMCRFIAGKITPYAIMTDSQGRSPEYLGAYEDLRGNLWAFGDTYLINLAEGKRFNYFRSSESASVRIWSLCEGRDGRLWIGTSGRGLFCFDDNRFQPVTLDENRWPYDVRAICEDREGNLWLGTSGGGLVQLRLQSMHVLRAGQGLPPSPPTALALDASGRIYAGVERGGLYVGEAGRFDRVGGSDGLMVQSFISSISIGHDGTVWAGTLGNGLYCLQNGRLVQLTTADGLADDSVPVVCPDADGGAWIGTTAGILQHFSGLTTKRFDEDGLPRIRATCVIPAQGGGYWFGTQDGQLWREQNGSFTDMKLSEDEPILSLYQDGQGKLWVGTDGDGLICVTDKARWHWNSYSGLPDNIVAGMVQDAGGSLWLVTGAGIYQVSQGNLLYALATPKSTLACDLMSEAKTVPESTAIFGGVRAALTQAGELWFATSEGILNVDTHQSGIDPATFPVCIESATFNGQPPISLLRGNLWSSMTDTNYAYRAPVDLSSLEIHFTALNFASPKQIQFRHRLEGSDLDWVDDGSARSVRYSRLSYGRYRFRVAARSANGNWQEGGAFDFIVPTPIYLQTWAIGLYVLTAIGFITATVRVVSHRRLRTALARLEQQQLLERERMRIARDMHDEMGSKLTKISFLSEHAQADAEATGPLAGKIRTIAESSRELLKTMDEIVWVVNPRNDTLDNLVTYLSHYAVEYFQNTSIECNLRLPPEIPHSALSSETRHNLFLTFEETLNNVLKHSGATLVTIDMTVNGLEFELKVSDNGKGFAAPVSAAPDGPSRGGRGGNGFKNMRQRLLAIGGECLISSQPGTGTSVTMRMKITKPSRQT